MQISVTVSASRELGSNKLSGKSRHHPSTRKTKCTQLLGTPTRSTASGRCLNLCNSPGPRECTRSALGVHRLPKRSDSTCPPPTLISNRSKAVVTIAIGRSIALRVDLITATCLCAKVATETCSLSTYIRTYIYIYIYVKLCSYSPSGHHVALSIACSSSFC